MARSYRRPILGMLIVLNASAVLGAIADFSVSALLTHYPRALAEIRVEAKTSLASIVVATREIPFGTTVAAEDVTLLEVPTEDVAHGAAQDPAKVIGRVAIERLLPGEAIREERLSRLGAGFDLSAVLADGMRAQTIDVGDAAGASGMLIPGDRVDVIASVYGADHRQFETRTIVRGVRVLAVDDRHIASEERGTTLNEGITLEVTPPQAEILTFCARTGPLHLTVLGSAEARFQ